MVQRDRSDIKFKDSGDILVKEVVHEFRRKPHGAEQFDRWFEGNERIAGTEEEPIFKYAVGRGDKIL